MRSCTLVFFLFIGIACYSQSIPFHTLSTVGGGATSGSNFKLSGAIGQPIISSGSASGVRLESGFMPSVLAFSNNFPPAIVFATLPKSALSDIEVDVSDPDGIDKVRFHYRKIASLEFDSVELTGPAANRYVKNISTNLVDAMGIEFYFTATDITGLRSVLPAEQNTYFQRYSTADGILIPHSAYNIGRKRSEYRIISIPYVLSSKGIGQQLDELADENSQHSKSNYRLATYAGNDEWHEFPSSSLNEFTRGKGYWFLTNITSDISLQGTSTPQEHQRNLFELTLKPEWNQIGNPYPLPINWSDVQDYNPGINIKGLHVYKDKAAFESGETLQPFEGGFVYLDETSEKVISIPFQGQEPGGGRLKSKEFSADISSDVWQLKLKLQVGERINELASIGMHPEALDGNDFFDDYHPPRFANYSEINFPHPEYRVKNFARDIASRQEKYTWTFSVNASAEEQLALQWSNESLGNNSIELYLLDEINSQLINMREKNTHPVSKNASYKIYYGENILSDIMPQVSGAGTPYPNPWTPGRSEDIHIPFALPGKNISHHVTLDIVDVSGRNVKQLMNASMTSGFYEAKWNGKDQNEETCSQGLYLLRLSIESNGASRNFHHRIIIKQQL